MDLKNLFKKDYVVGIDIGSYSVKIAQFAVREGGLYLLKAELKDVGISKDSESYEKDLILALHYLIRGVDLKKSKVIININCSCTAIKKITFPYMPKSELREGIMLASKNYFPFQIDKSALDFEIVGDVVDKGIRKYEVMVGVCPSDTINKYLSLVQKAGIRPASFVLSSHSLHKLALNLSRNVEGVQCYVDIGSLQTELVICKDGLLAFSRKIPVCGNDFTRALTSAVVTDKGKIQLSAEEAEKIKKDVGMPGESDSRVIDNKIPAAQVLAMLRTHAEHLVNEIDRCFNFYHEESGSGRINSVTIFGGGASLSGLTKFLSQGLGMEVKLGDALEGLKTDAKTVIHDMEKVSHRMDLAIGAALTQARGLNILPSEIKDQMQRTVKRGTIAAIITAVIIASILTFVGTRIKIGNFDKRISAAKLQLTSLQPEIKKAGGMRLAEMVLKNEPYWEDVFRELGSIIPGEAVIKHVRMQGDHLYMKGIIASSDGQQMLSDFVIELEDGLFSDVKLVESRNLPDKSGIEFEIACWVDYER
ncbi:MAG: type IV pilus assembly protein PilM [Candidatus Omnitrophota bacterium]|nr:type IV pilus assembly protein PilM [Candidatus Omnitrophota bacterium]